MTDVTLLGRPELIGAPEDFIEWMQKSRPRNMQASAQDDNRQVGVHELAKLLAVATDPVVQSVLTTIRDQGHVIVGNKAEYAKVGKTNRYLSVQKRYRLYQSSPTGVEPKRYSLFKLP